MSSLSAVWAALGARVFGKKLLVYSGNDWAADTNLKFARAPALLRGLVTAITDCLETMVLRVADFRLVNSPQLSEKCQRLRGPFERVRPVSRFRLSDAFSREDTCRAEMVRIVYPAAVIPRKNHVTLLQALARLRARGVAAELLLAGAVESEQIKVELLGLAATLDVSEQVRFLGYVAGKDEMLALLRGADVFVLPSLNEGFPRVIWEAMLQSLPCAVSSIPNIWADIGHRDVALMFDPLDADDMANALYRIITDGELRRRLIHEGHAYACDVFGESWDQQLARVMLEWVR
jgi:glycosyltransferase involved in cell wall biosynthesis